MCSTEVVHSLLKVVPKLTHFKRYDTCERQVEQLVMLDYEAKIVLFVLQMREGRGIKINQMILGVKIFTARYACSHPSSSKISPLPASSEFPAIETERSR